MNEYKYGINNTVQYAAALTKLKIRPTSRMITMDIANLYTNVLGVLGLPHLLPPQGYSVGFLWFSLVLFGSLWSSIQFTWPSHYSLDVLILVTKSTVPLKVIIQRRVVVEICKLTELFWKM
jgi:hypothetical protein